MVLGLIACFKCFQGLDFIANIICISFICHLSSDDPFEHYIIGNSSLYFDDLPNITNITNITNIIANIEKYNKTNDKELYHFYNNEEQIVQGSKDNSSNITIDKNLFLRRLVSNSFCTKTRLKFDRYKGEYLSNIFKLNIKKIHKISIGLIVVICAPIVITIITLSLLAIFGRGGDFSSICLGCGSCGIISSLITNLVLLIILAVYYNKGDIGEYKDFLDCKNVKKNYFDQFSDVVKLSKFIIAFEIVDAIFEVIGTLLEIGQAADKKNNGEDY